MKACARKPSRATNTSAAARFSPAAARRARELRHDEGVVALGRAAQGYGAAFEAAEAKEIDKSS